MSRLEHATQLTLLHHALAGVAEEMGEILKRSSRSPNIKERQDYSCALFDSQGRLLAQGAHLPVHLGSMPASVDAVLDAMTLVDGDCAIVNDPYNGGTHLPDITLVMPVFDGNRLLGYVANRAHHADIGGASPGSMAPQTDLIAEGLVIPPVLLMRAGERNSSIWPMILSNTRTPLEREADLLAQWASCRRGSERLIEVIQRVGVRRFGSLAGELMKQSTKGVQVVARGLKAGTYDAVEYLEDDGAGTENIALRLRLTVSSKGLTFDFRKSDPQVAGGVNAVRAVTTSSVLYSVLCLADPVPAINAGCFRPLRVVTSSGTVVDAKRPAAVAGGNVEASQRMVDLCFAAFHAAGANVCAQSQGTMNNLTLGGVCPERGAFTYYETTAGGYGASRSSDGADSTHCHMTNTLNTPVEAMEHSYPVRVEEVSLRVNSGGSGEHAGGDGVTRRVRVLVDSDYAVLAERRRLAPKGINADDGAVGANILIRDKRKTKLPAKAQGTLRAGDAIEIRTPGGGGHSD